MAAVTQPTVFLSSHPSHSKSTDQRHSHAHLSNALENASCLDHLKQIHGQILRFGLDRSDTLLLKLTVSSCALSSNLDYPFSVLGEIYKPDPGLRNKFLRELSRSSQPDRTLRAYEKLRTRGLSIDRFSFPPLLKASSRAVALMEGMEIHGFASKLGFDSDPFVQTALMGMYCDCRRVKDARLLFDRMSHRDVVSWNIMIDGYCRCGMFEEVLRLYEDMSISNVKPDKKIFSTMLTACGRAGNLDFGKVVHEFIANNNIEVDSHLQSALITMYAGCGDMHFAQCLYDKLSSSDVVASTAMVSGYSKLREVDAARLIFDQIVEKDLVCWSAMISGYAESDQPEESLKLFNEMLSSGINPDQVTMLSVISACAHLGSLNQAKRIHMFVDDNEFGEILAVNNALIDMYAKCGSLEKATDVFNWMKRKNVISWTSIINAFAMHGDASNALKHFEKMKMENIEPNSITFVGVLYACSHAGFVEEGKKLFASMVNDYSITPKHEHYGCMVDLYGRANFLGEALQVVENMPIPPNSVIWGSLMAACCIHGDLELGKFAAKQLLELDPGHDGAHVLLSNIYAKEKLYGDVVQVKELMRRRGVAKERGYSRIELNNEVHEFLVADKSHEQSDEIYAELEEVVSRLKLVGYTPNVSGISIDLDEEEKREVVLWHSEKLAFCYGLIRRERGSCIRIIKNLRICEDCHTFMKLASKVFEREIVVRDRTRFHHYRNGLCSCKDYW